VFSSAVDGTYGLDHARQLTYHQAIQFFAEGLIDFHDSIFLAKGK
jgi:hypothetical protein